MFSLNKFDNSSFTVSVFFFLVMVFATTGTYKKEYIIFKLWFVTAKNVSKKVEGVLKKNKNFSFVTLPSKILDKSGLP